jgi:probable metal-binding protein
VAERRWPDPAGRLTADNRAVELTMRNDTQIHGHEVMQMMLGSGISYTRDSLRDAILERFGSDARFFTCSCDNLTAAALIDFLADRGKFVPRADGFTTDPTKLCRHEE